MLLLTNNCIICLQPKDTVVKKRNREKTDFNYESLSESESGSLSDSEEDTNPPVAGKWSLRHFHPSDTLK